MRTTNEEGLLMAHHHHSANPEKRKRERRLKAITYTFFFMALLMLIPYLATEFLPFITSIRAHGKVNFSTMCYTFLRIMLVLIPVVLTMPSKPYKAHIEKTNLLSKVFSLTSFLFFCGLVADILTYNIFGDYVDVGSDPIMIKMLFGCTDISGVAFCFVQGVFYLLLSKKIKEHKKDVVILTALAYITYIVMPFAGMIVNHTVFFTRDWYTWFNKNLWLWAANFFVLAGLISAAQSRRTWSEIIWK